MKIDLNTLALISIAAGIGFACQTAETKGDKMANTAETNEGTPFELEELERATTAFKSGDGEAFAARYAPDGMLVLSNGTVIRGPALSPAAASAGPTVKEWSLSSPRVHRNEAGSYVAGASRTVLQPPGAEAITIDGTRLVAWNGAGEDASIQVDFNMAGARAAVPGDLRARLDSLESSWNAHDLEGTRAHFAEDAVYVLSDSRVFVGDALNGVFGFAFKSGFSDMTFEPKAAWKAGESWFVASDFSFAMAPEGKRVEISGCQVDLWTQVDGEWRIAAEVAQPATSPACL